MKIKKNIAISETGLVFNPAKGESYSVNPVGADILNLIREGKTIREISRAIQAKYSVDRQTFERDLAEFMDLLRQYEITGPDGKKKA
jgi:hypothetical protein